MMLNEAILESAREIEQEISMDVLKQVTDIFFQQAPIHLKNIQQGLQQCEPIAVFKAAHTLKGSCSYLGMKEMQRLCEKLEEWSNDPEKSNLEAYVILQCLQKELDNSSQQLKEVLTSLHEA